MSLEDFQLKDNETIDNSFINRDLPKIHHQIFSIKNDVDLLSECGFLKNNIIRLSLHFKIILLEQHEYYLDYNQNEEKWILEKNLNK